MVVFSFLSIVDCADKGTDTGHDNVGVGTGTPCDCVVAPDKPHIGGCAGGRALVQAVLRVVFQMEVHAGGALDSVGYGIQTAVAH